MKYNNNNNMYHKGLCMVLAKNGPLLQNDQFSLKRCFDNNLIELRMNGYVSVMWNLIQRSFAKVIKRQKSHV